MLNNKLRARNKCVRKPKLVRTPVIGVDDGQARLALLM